MKAKPVRATVGEIKIAGSCIEVFQLPNGEFRYSRAGAASAVGKIHTDVANFFKSTTAKELLGTDLEVVSVKKGRTHASALTDKQVSAYWHWKAENGNVEAQALVRALTMEALHRRACVAFDVVVSEEQHEERTEKNRIMWLDSIRKQLEGLPAPDLSTFDQVNPHQHLIDQRDELLDTMDSDEINQANIIRSMRQQGIEIYQENGLYTCDQLKATGTSWTHLDTPQEVQQLLAIASR